jgi:hypothetical protein
MSRASTRVVKVGRLLLALDAGTEMLSIEDPAPVTAAGENAHVAPHGRSEQKNVTLCENPWRAFIEMAVVTVCPALTDSEVGLAAIVKSGGPPVTFTVTDPWLSWSTAPLSVVNEAATWSAPAGRIEYSVPLVHVACPALLSTAES